MSGLGREEALSAQLFRRIGYTNGLAYLLRYSEICDLVGSQPTVAKVLINRVSERFKVDTPDSKGRLDVSASFGLLNLVAGRYSIAAMGRAARAIAGTNAVHSAESRAFFFRRVVQTDADYTLTLLLTLDRVGPRFSVPQYPEYASALNRLLEEKLKRVSAAPVPLLLRKLAKTRLLVEWRRPAKSPIERLRHDQERRRMKFRYSRIEMPDDVLTTWVRHTIDPRKSWLVDLGLTRKTADGYELSDSGRRLVEHLRLVADAGAGYAVLDAERDILREYSLEHLLTTTTVDWTYWDTMTSFAIAGRGPEFVQLDPSAFLELLSSAYSQIKLEQFPQAETLGLREVVTIPFLIRAQRIDFDQQLKDLVRAEPGRVTRIPSPKDEAAYVSLRSR